jgi:hypothetical protein
VDWTTGPSSPTGWNAGRAFPLDPGTSSAVTLIAESWEDSKIVRSGFAGSWGSNGWTLADGNEEQINVWNAQSGSGPASITTTVGAPAAFFRGEVPVGGGVYYLQFTNVFGFYNLGFFPWIFHYDIGFEYFIDAMDSQSGAFLYDNTSGHFFYTSPSLFPYLYDFTLKNWLYYFPATDSPGHYTANPRYFANLGTSAIFTM